MAITVVAGGFFGDEGKGKIVSYLALKDKVSIAVRTGSVNAGHTVLWRGETYKLRLIPSAFIYEKARLLIGAGANVNVKIFFNEAEKTNTKNRVGIDYQASIIEEKHIKEDRGSKYLSKKIGTTGQGVGPAIAERVRRSAKLAKEIKELEPYLTDVSEEIYEASERGENILLEGTQATFISLYHGTYPYVTSRDTTASAICSEAGVGPTKIDDVILVFKAYVTRVGAGPLPGEITIQEAEKRGWLERATVAGRTRRAAPFNYQLAKKAVRLNGATQIALTKIDVLYPECKNAKRYEELTEEAKRFIQKIEDELKVPVTFIGTGPEAESIIDLRSER